MSGFEIAGIALAVFPIVVDGLGHFAQGVQTIKEWRRYRVKLQDYAGMMESARVFYLDTLEELLNGIVQSEDEMEALMATPGGLNWQQPRYDKRLKQRLGRSYDPYLRTLNTMIDSMGKICEKLGINTSGKVLWDDYSIIKRAMKRIKVTISKNIYKELLNDLDKANKDIRDITHQNVYLEPMRKKRRSKRPIAEFRLIRKCAASLYQVLVIGKGTCECQNHHWASLRLEPRIQIHDETEVNIPSQFRFRILLSTSQGKGALSKTTSQWHEVEVVPFMEHTDNNAVTLDPKPSSRSIWSALGTGSWTAAILPRDSSKEHERNLILNLCAELYTSSSLAKASGFLIDEGKKQKLPVYRTNTSIGSDNHSQSLRDLLSNSRHVPSNVSLSRGDRLQIATILASSVLQLDGTSWLTPSEWTSNDIYFHTDNNTARPTHRHPYLRWKICMANNNNNNNNSHVPPHPVTFSASVTTTLDHLTDRSPILLALGQTLIELCFGQTLSDMRKPEDSSCDSNSSTEEEEDIIARYRTARRILNSVYDEMGTSYGDVVRRCLLQPFDVRGKMSLESNEELWMKVFDGVVVPLLEDWESFCGRARMM